MNLLIDRIENPGQRKVAPLVPSVSNPLNSQDRRKATDTSVGDSGKNNATTSHIQQPSLAVQGEASRKRSVEVPTISVNDEPIASRKASQPRNSISRKSSLTKPSDKEQPHERRSSAYHHARHGTGSADVTSASAGMFSECMFKSESQKPTRHSPSSTTTSSSSSSIYAHKNGDSLRRNQFFNEHSVLMNSIPSEPFPHRHRHHHHGHGHLHQSRHPSSVLHKKHANSFSSCGTNDNKRLVNQFLRSMEPAVPVSRMLKSSTPPSLANSTTSTPGGLPEQAPSSFAGYISGTHGSLQSLLYRDLGSLHMKKKHQTGPPQPFGVPSSSSSSNSSSFSVLPDQASSSSSSETYDSSEESSSMGNFERTNETGSSLVFNSGVSLNYNEVDYYRRHIGAELRRFEDILKHNLKEVIMKNESDMEKNWKTFDALILQLGRLRKEASDLHGLIKDKNLLSLRKDFDSNDEHSFISTLNVSIKTNASQLKDLEKRIDVCKKRLLQQRETLRKLEGLLNLEDSLLNSKKTAKLAYKYRYVVFDIGAIIGIVLVILFARWLIWRY